MQLLFGDYTDLVLKAYEKKGADQLPLLAHLTTANIRKECLNVYTERIERGAKDEEYTLRLFFGVPPAGKNFSHIIRKCKADKFRSLQSFIKRETKSPGLANVELLAWLIDFNPRPLSHAQQTLKGINEPTSQVTGSNESQPKPDPTPTDIPEIEEVVSSANSISTEILPQEGGMTPSITNNKEVSYFSTKNLKGSPEGSKLKMAAVIGLITAVLFGGMYFIWQREGTRQTSFGKASTGCMYWADDHYEKVPCTEERKGRLILPLNEEKMKSFKRITREDTITERSIGKVYYIKSNKKIEYYTEGGDHPVETTRSLKKLSAYMFDKYLRNQEMANESLLSEKPLKFINNH